MTATVPSLTAAPRSATTRAAWDGVAAMLPLAAGFVPFGLVVGLAAAESSIGSFAGLLTGVTIVGGSGQLVAIDRLDAGVPLVAILTTLAVQARVIVYAASLATHWRGESTLFKAVAAYFVIEPTFAVASARYADPSHADDASERRAFYLAAAAAMMVAWLGAIAVGAYVGGDVPDWLGLELAAPVVLVSLLAGHVRDEAGRTAVVVGALVAVAATPLPLGTGLLLGGAAGIAAGAHVERRTSAEADPTSEVSR